MLAKLQAKQAPLSNLPTVRSPLASGGVVSAFGPRLHPIFAEERMHAGVDIPAAVGDPLYSAMKGVVAYTGEQEGYGFVTVVDHDGQMATLYAHQHTIGVKVGQKVARGKRSALWG